MCHGVVSWLCHEGYSMLRYPRVMGGGVPLPCPHSPHRAWAEIPPQELFFDMRTKTQVDRHRRVYTGGVGRFTRACWGYPAPHPDFFTHTKLEYGTEMSRNAQNRRWVLALHVTLISLQSTPERATDLPSYMTLISLQSAPDSGGARQHHSPMQDR